jgi:D-glycero-D-manno-heptose 1,7-bisphosphate phosphatase
MLRAQGVRHVILDRDGVLNVEAADRGYVTSPHAWQWLPGSLEALAMLARARVRVSVATNQSGVGRGIMTLRDLAAVHDRMQQDALAVGGRIDAVFTCPHAPGARCLCRKPAPGLLLEAVAASGIAADSTLVVGDDRRDIEAARSLGLQAVLVRTGKGGRAEAALTQEGVAVYDDLRALVRELIAAPETAGSHDP